MTFIVADRQPEPHVRRNFYAPPVPSTDGHARHAVVAVAPHADPPPRMFSIDDWGMQAVLGLLPSMCRKPSAAWSGPLDMTRPVVE